MIDNINLSDEDFELLYDKIKGRLIEDLYVAGVKSNNKSVFLPLRDKTISYGSNVIDLFNQRNEISD